MFKFLRLGRHLPSFLKSHEESNTFLEYGLLFNRVNLVFGGNGEEPVQQQRSGSDLDVIRWSVVVMGYAATVEYLHALRRPS